MGICAEDFLNAYVMEFFKGIDYTRITFKTISSDGCIASKLSLFWQRICQRKFSQRNLLIVVEGTKYEIVAVYSGLHSDYVFVSV